ncbi:hypothetical protein HDU84_007574, partial [Entophlyctis sp. JEL0112]
MCRLSPLTQIPALLLLHGLVIAPLPAAAVFIDGAKGHYNARLSSSAILATIDCVYTYQTAAGDTCGSIAANYAMARSFISPAAFATLNPDITCGNDVNLPVDNLVCVSSAADAGSASSTTGSSTDGTNTTLSCTVGYVLRNGDVCDSVAAAFGLSSSLRFELNPHLDCSDTNVFVGQELCLEAVGNSTTGTIIVGGPQTASKYSGAVDMVEGCTDSVVLNSTADPSCLAFVASYSNITITELAAWNSGIDCWNTTANAGVTVCIHADSSLQTTSTNNATVVTTASETTAHTSASLSSTAGKATSTIIATTDLMFTS